jgi:hypothetical protein
MTPRNYVKNISKITKSSSQSLIANHLNIPLKLADGFVKMA